MDKESIVKAFFEKNKLLTPGALEAVKDGYQELSRNFSGLVLDVQDFHAFRVLKNIEKQRTEITTEDFISYYKSKYEAMKKIITERISEAFVSLNNVDKESFVIGMVKSVHEKQGKKLIRLEDMTASAQAIFEKAEIGRAHV